MSDANIETTIPKSKRKLTPYNIFFRNYRYFNTNEEDNSKEYMSKLTKAWKDIKENEYEYSELLLDCKYENLFEVTKPFHYYSLKHRRFIERENPDYKADEITNRLKMDWDNLSYSEQIKWDIN